MSQENCQKIKLLKLVELLRQETDEQHPMTTHEICNRLIAMGISCERRTVTRDVALLNEQGYEVMSRAVGKAKGYYIEDRSFSLPELKILMDAVQAASFVTVKKTAELIDKIAELAGVHKAKLLKSNMVCFNTRKHTNESIYYNVDFIEEALQTRKKIIFCYYDLNDKGEKVYRRSGHHYVVEPVALVFSEDNYYLIVYSSRHDGTAIYRVDRMDKVEVTGDEVCEKAVALRDSVGDCTEQAFRMYAGEPVEVVLQFKDALLGVIYDKFGEQTAVERIDEKTCTARVTVQVSPTFWGWLSQFTGDMQILTPEEVRSAYRKHIRKAEKQHMPLPQPEAANRTVYVGTVTVNGEEVKTMVLAENLEAARSQAIEKFRTLAPEGKEENVRVWEFGAEKQGIQIDIEESNEEEMAK